MRSIRGCLCKTSRILLPLYLLFLLFLAGSAVLAGRYASGESVYFWRIAEEGGIYTVPGDGNTSPSPIPLTAINRQGCVGCHVVSSTADRIAVSTRSGTGKLQIFTLNDERIPIPSIHSSYYSWSVDGERLVYANDDKDIYILDVIAKTARPVQGASTPGVIETMPTWSPDDSTIAFVRSKAADDGFKIDAPCDIYTIPASGGVARPLPGASGGGFNYYPAYSPDGKWLAFTRHTAGHTTYAEDLAEIFLVPAQGGTPKRLAANDSKDGKPLKGVSNSWPVWSRDGQRLAFNSKRNDEKFDIFITSIDANGNSGLATPLPGASEPGVFEHLPYWGKSPPLPSLATRLWALWPWLLPLLFILALSLACRDGHAAARYAPVPSSYTPTRRVQRKPEKPTGGGFRPKTEEKPRLGRGGFRPPDE